MGDGEQDHYAILGVPAGAKLAEIKTAYRNLAKRCHPDNGESACVETFKRVNTAHSVLSVQRSRAAYDAKRRVASPSSAYSSAYGSSSNRTRGARAGENSGGPTASNDWRGQHWQNAYEDETQYRSHRMHEAMVQTLANASRGGPKWYAGQSKLTRDQAYFSRKFTRGVPTEEMFIRRAVRISQGRSMCWYTVPLLLLGGVVWQRHAQPSELGISSRLKDYSPAKR